MFFILLYLSYSNVIYYNATNNLDITDNNSNSYAIFCFYDYSNTLIKEQIKQIYLCSRLIPTINIYVVNCSKTDNERICLKYDSTKSTIIHLITTTIQNFDGEFIAFDLINFFEQNTNHKRINITTTYGELTPDNFSDYQRSKTSTLITFLDMTEEKSRIMIPQIQQMAFIFSNKPKIGVAFVDCHQYRDFCIDKNVEFVPTFRSYHDNSFVDFNGPRYFPDLLSFANRQLDEFRSADGELNKNAGIIESLKPLVTQFMKEQGKKGIISQAEKIKGSEFYIRLMKRILKYGETILDKDEASIKSMLKQSPEKLSQRDILRENLNILKEFKHSKPYIPDDQEL